MKIAIFENEYESIRFAFETASLINFDGLLDITIYPSSQTANLEKVSEVFEVIFIDIDLSSKSHQDGYSLIKNLLNLKQSLENKIVILTGNNKIKESLIERGIDVKNLIIIIKPTDYDEISQVIKKVIAL